MGHKYWGLSHIVLEGYVFGKPKNVYIKDEPETYFTVAVPEWKKPVEGQNPHVSKFEVRAKNFAAKSAAMASENQAVMVIGNILEDIRLPGNYFVSASSVRLGNKIRVEED